MNIYQKLNEARAMFHSSEIKKTGRNAFAKYNYFELADFVVPALNIFSGCGLTAITSFTEGLATMTIVNCDQPDERITISSPLGSADLKGCHVVQNIGACETYQRRYLWMAALEIVEHDAIDSSEPKNDEHQGRKKGVHKPTDGALVSEGRLQVIADAAIDMIALHAKGDIAGAFEVRQQITDAEEVTALWDKLPSKVRSDVKKYGASIEEFL